MTPRFNIWPVTPTKNKLDKTAAGLVQNHYKTLRFLDPQGFLVYQRLCLFLVVFQSHLELINGFINGQKRVFAMPTKIMIRFL